MRCALALRVLPRRMAALSSGVLRRAVTARALTTAAAASPARAAAASASASATSASIPASGRMASPMWKSIGATGKGTRVSVVGTAGKHTVVTDEPTHQGGTDTAATPLHTLLVALMGCEQATVQFLVRKHFPGVTVDAIDFDLTGEYDARGILGVDGVPARFQAVKGTATVRTNATQAQVDALVAMVYARCPVANLFVGAGVKMDVKWIKA